MQGASLYTSYKTPLKMNMEPNNHQKTKEKSSEPNLNFWRFSMFIKPRVYYLDFCVSISEESRLLTVFFSDSPEFRTHQWETSRPCVWHISGWGRVGSPRVKIFPNFRGGSIEKCLSCHQLATWVMKLWTTTWYCGTISPLYHDGTYECLKKKCYLIIHYMSESDLSAPPLERKKRKTT